MDGEGFVCGRFYRELVAGTAINCYGGLPTMEFIIFSVSFVVNDRFLICAIFYLYIFGSIPRIL